MPIGDDECTLSRYENPATVAVRKLAAGIALADGEGWAPLETPVKLRALLAFLLRLSSIRGGEPSEIARRTKEVLDQFERNVEQQQVP